MVATKEDVLAVAPEFAPVCAAQGQDPEFANAFRLVGPLVNDEALGAKAPIAGAYRVAHFLAKTYPALASNAVPVVEKRLGPLGLKYAVATPEAGDLVSTAYGLAYLEIVGRAADTGRRTLGAMVI